jgi:hypothetical protein
VPGKLLQAGDVVETLAMRWKRGQFRPLWPSSINATAIWYAP